MKKIGFLIASKGWGGLEMNTLKLAGWLLQRGYPVDIFTIRNSRLYEEAKLLAAGLHEIALPGKYFDFANAGKISELLKSAGIEVLFVFDNRDISVVSIIKNFFCKNLKVIYQQHMQIGINKRDLFHTLRYSGIDLWISPSKYLAEEVARRTRFPQSKVRIIPLGVEVARFTQPGYTKEAARKLLDIPANSLLLGVIGRISPKKGQYFLARAIPELLKKGIDAELLIFGSPTVNDPGDIANYGEIKKFVAAQRLGDKVHFTEHSKDIALFYNAIDICVLASEGETYGMVTIEAMLSGVPVIATNSAGTPEMLNYGELGLLYTYEDFDSFCGQVAALLNNKAKAGEMAEKARSTAFEKFSHVKECDQIEELLKKL